mmetsp:Transcript_9039/g.24344  ORF Transcript_9039/g.24344 Transcript_9039/m.24344 type:complete len:505 (-) Transcript_9039:148-1662(-)
MFHENQVLTKKPKLNCVTVFKIKTLGEQKEVIYHLIQKKLSEQTPKKEQKILCKQGQTLSCCLGSKLAVLCPHRDAVLEAVWRPLWRVASSDELGTHLLQLIHGSRSEQSHGALELVLENVDRLLDPRLSSSSQAVEVSLTAAHGISTERDGLGDIRSSHDTSVENDLDVWADGSADSWQGIDRWDRGLKLPSTVIGDPQGCETVVQRLDGLVLPDHALQGELSTPLLGEPLRVLPVEVGAKLLVDEGGHGLCGNVLVDVRVRVHVVAQEIPGPSRALGGLVDLPEGVAWRDAESVTDVSLPLSEPSEVGSQGNRVVTVLPRLLQQVAVQFLVLPEVTLEHLGKRLWEDLSYILHARGGERGEPEHNAVVSRHRSHSLLSEVMKHSMSSGWAAEERHAHVPAEYFRREVESLRGVTSEDAVVTLVLVVGASRTSQGDLVVSAAVKVSKAHLVRAQTRGISQVPRVAALVQPRLCSRVDDRLDQRVEEPEELIEPILVDKRHSGD